MIKSMTAFGRAERTLDERSYIVEMRSLNRRYCEISVHLPQQLLALEERIKKLVSAKVSRGRVDVAVKVKSGPRTTTEVEVNLPQAKVYYEALSQLREVLGVEEKIGLQIILGLEGVVTAKEPEVDLEETWAALLPCVDEALEGMELMRIAEGKAIYDDFQKRLQCIEETLSTIKAFAPSVLSEYHSRLTERITALTEGKVELDPNRLAQEAAFLADRSDITEEIVRAESHLKQFRRMVDSGEPSGRGLDFLLQELNREINTIGSKGGDAEMSHMVVGVKSELEKIREQVQNIE